jgi:hypothetical protein
MSVFARVHMPSLGGATEWLNSEPLGPAELREVIEPVGRFGEPRAAAPAESRRRGAVRPVDRRRLLTGRGDSTPLTARRASPTTF